jgi:hypothetical protein
MENDRENKDQNLPPEFKMNEKVMLQQKEYMNQMGMGQFMLVPVPVPNKMMANCPDYRFMPMNNYGFYYPYSHQGAMSAQGTIPGQNTMQPQGPIPNQGAMQHQQNRQPRHYPAPFMMFTEQENSNTSMHTVSTQARGYEKVPKSRSDSPARNANAKKLSLDSPFKLTTINEKTANSEESSNVESSNRGGSLNAPRLKNQVKHLNYKYELNSDGDAPPQLNNLKNSLLHKEQAYRQEPMIKVDVSSLQSMNFENVKDIREKIDHIFAPQNVKMICKRAERIYANGY